MILATYLLGLTMFPAMNYSRIAITIRKPEISAETGVNIEAQTETADDPCMRQPGRGTKDGPIPTFLYQMLAGNTDKGVP